MTNITDIEAARAKRRRAKAKKKAVTYLIVLAAVLVFMIFRRYLTAAHIGMVVKDTLSDFSSGSYPISLTEGVPKSVEAGEKGVCFTTSSTVVIYNQKGAMVQNTAHNMASPNAVSQGRYKLVFDRGNKNFALFSQTEKLYAMSAEQKILDGDVNAKGQCVLATSSVRYLSQLTAYDTDGKSLFSWSSPTDYVIGVDFDSNFIAVAAARMEQNNIAGQLYLLNIKKDSELFSVSLPGEMPLKVRQNGSFITLYTDKGYYCYNRNGELIGSFLFENSSLQKTDSDVGSRVCFVLGSGSSLNRVAVVDRKGNLLCEIDPQDTVLGVHCVGSKTAVLTAEKLLVYDKEGTLVDEKDYAKTCLNLYAQGSDVYVQLSDSLIKEKI